MENNLKKLQQTQLEILLAFDAAMKKHNITYYLVDGTCLGAVRHQGFIPWDDDVDVAIMAKDEKRMIAACQQELSEDYFIQGPATEKQVPLGFYKLRKNGTKLVEEINQDLPIHHGIAIDVFILYGLPTTKLASKMMRVYSYLYTVFLNKKTTFSKKILNIVYKLLRPFSRFICAASFQGIQRITKRHHLHESETVCNIFFVLYYDATTMPRNYYGTPKLLPFEGHLLPVPEKTEAYLQAAYGDYMQLPPESERVQIHDIVHIDFGS